MSSSRHISIIIFAVFAAGSGLIALISFRSHFRPDSMHTRRDKPLIIAPHIAGNAFCASALQNRQIKNNEQAALFCYLRKETPTSTVEKMLNSLDSGNKSNHKYVLGYTLTLPLSRYFQRGPNAEWMPSLSRLNHDLKIITELNRPVHIYLNFNHFLSGNQEFAVELARNAQNIMWNAHGPMPITQYFGIDIIPWTISNLDAPISRYKELILEETLKKVSEINIRYPHRIIGISLLGESHHLDKDLSAGPSYSVDLSETTDYSPVAIAQFQSFLQDKYKTIDKLNRQAKTRYRKFKEIQPLQKKSLSSLASNPLSKSIATNYSHGTIDFYGWFIDDNNNCNRRLSIELNGRHIKSSQSDLNRTDVAEALKIKNPNVGFRFSLDFKELPAGSHEIVVYAKCHNKRVLIGRRYFSIASKDHVSVLHYPKNPKYFTSLNPPGVRFYLDGPPDQLNVEYNHIIFLWHLFRQQAVKRYIENFAQLATKYLPSNLIYSYQINTSFNGSWNPLVTAEVVSNHPSPLFGYGATLYGGAAFGEPFFSFLRANQIHRYAVVETNPMSDLGVDGYKRFLEKHRINGAEFIAPYYLSLISDLLPSGELNFFELKPGNATKHSDQFYQAIKEILASS